MATPNDMPPRRYKNGREAVDDLLNQAASRLLAMAEKKTPAEQPKEELKKDKEKREFNLPPVLTDKPFRGDPRLRKLKKELKR